ncbi:MAG: 1-deoxy-D-xylulose-5-phosphate reductoisomerase, partial [Lysobacterales bacterium]
MKKKNVVILGSTGSIGINTLKVVMRYPDHFNVVGLTAYNNYKLLEKQIKQFKPKQVATTDKSASYLKTRINTSETKILSVDHDLEEMVAQKAVDTVVIGMRGSSALPPFLSAVREGKIIAPANKEALVIAGDIIMCEAAKSKAIIVPVDSEQSAIFQCLEGHNRSDLKKVCLTASGGTLRDVVRSKFDQFSVEEMLEHPTWKMGTKITVDSAMLMNKGFEFIEAKVLFGLHIDEIEVVIHPESIIHSMVEFVDGSMIAQLGVTDMRIPIQYALTYPKRLDVGLKSLDLCKLGQLNFSKPDLKKFPALSLCIHVAKKGGTLPSVLNAADEEAVEAYLNGDIKFTRIYDVVEKI